MGISYLGDLFQRSDRDARTRPFITFKTFASKMQPSLTQAFGESIASDLIGDYLKGEGSRCYMLYLFYKLLCDKTNMFFSIGDFSEIMFGNRDKASVLMRIPTPAIRDLNQMWTIEYMITHIKANKRLGFNPGEGTLNDIIKEATIIVRKNFISQVSEALSPVAVIMILESLKALSEIRGYRVSFNELSKLIDRNQNKLFITRMLASGRSAPRAATMRLLELLTSEGVNPDHMAIQFVELFLNTRGLAHINFDFYLRELNVVLDSRQTSKTTLTQEKRLMARSIVWGLTAGRSWITGEKMTYDQTVLHHVRHDPNGKTLYGGYYDTLKNFAAVRGDKENKLVEGVDQQKYETIFIYMWEMFKQGEFRKATMHWDPIFQDEFIKDLNSIRYLKYWISKI